MNALTGNERIRQQIFNLGLPREHCGKSVECTFDPDWLTFWWACTVCPAIRQITGDEIDQGYLDRWETIKAAHIKVI